MRLSAVCKRAISCAVAGGLRLAAMSGASRAMCCCMASHWGDMVFSVERLVLRHVLPPRPLRRFAVVEDFADIGRCHGERGSGSGFAEAFDRLLPSVVGKIEFCPVNRQHGLRAYIHRRLHGLFRLHVDVRPVRVIGAVFHQHDVKRPEAFADIGKVRAVAAVAIVEEAISGRLHHP